MTNTFGINDVIRVQNEGKEKQEKELAAERRKLAKAMAEPRKPKSKKKVTASVPASVKKSPAKAEKQMPVCDCGCKERTKGGRFRPGLDARYHSRLAGNVPKPPSTGHHLVDTVLGVIGKMTDEQRVILVDTMKIRFPKGKAPVVKPVAETVAA